MYAYVLRYFINISFFFLHSLVLVHFVCVFFFSHKKFCAFSSYFTCAHCQRCVYRLAFLASAPFVCYPWRLFRFTHLHQAALKVSVRGRHLVGILWMRTSRLVPHIFRHVTKYGCVYVGRRNDSMNRRQQGQIHSPLAMFRLPLCIRKPQNSASDKSSSNVSSVLAVGACKL